MKPQEEGGKEIKSFAQRSYIVTLLNQLFPPQSYSRMSAFPPIYIDIQRPKHDRKVDTAHWTSHLQGAALPSNTTYFEEYHHSSLMCLIPRDNRLIIHHLSKQSTHGRFIIREEFLLSK